MCNVICIGTSHVTKLNVPGLSVRRWAGAPCVREFSVISGITLGSRTLGVNNKDVDTLTASIAERVLRFRKGNTILMPLKPSKNVFATLLRFKKKVIFNYGDLPTPHTVEQFVAMYKGRRRTIYENASIDYLSGGVKTKHAVVRAFVKAEKVDTNKAPRCIQPRHPVYNIGLGVYLKHIEHGLYLAIARTFRQPFVVSKGLNVQQLGVGISEMWNSINDPCYVGFDASRFDMHVSQDALRWEHSIYNSMYKFDPTLKRLLNMQLANIGVGWCPDGRVKYKTKGCRMSGDMNTGLGNCLLMCGMVYNYMCKFNVDFKFIDNGDDCGVIINRKDLGVFDGLIDYFVLYGFRLEVEDPVYILERLVFCQMQPVCVDGTYVMVRQLVTALEKDSISIVPLRSEKMLRKWLYSIGECGLALCSGVPVMQSLYEAYMSNGLQSNMANATYMESGARNLTVGLMSKRSDVVDSTRESFALAFGITPCDQVALEGYYQEMVIQETVCTTDVLVVPGLLPTRIDQNLN